MELRVDFTSPVPIYRQIVEGFRLAIARDELAPGDRLPSVRDLATELAINPNTVSSAYREMLNLGLATSRKGIGLFLAEGGPALAAREKRSKLAERVDDLFRFAAGLGFDADEVAAVVTLGAYALPLGGPPPWVVKLMRYPAVLRGVGALGRSRLGRPLVRGAVERAFSPTPAPAAYLEIAPRLALQPAALLGDGADREVAEEGLAALRPRYPGLLTPIVIVVGAQDRMVPPAVSERLHTLVPRSELVRVPGAGHMPQFSAPDAVVAAVDRAADLAGPPAVSGGASTYSRPAFASPRSGG